jgi:nitrile hydratase subunit alpha
MLSIHTISYTILYCASAMLMLCKCWFVLCRYKSRSYRSRVVREPRTVLEEFGTIIPSNVAIRVHDSTADCRFLVLPMRPLKGTEGFSHEQLKAIVTRDSMVGVTVL